MIINATGFWKEFLEYLEVNDDTTEKIVFLVAKKERAMLEVIDWTFLNDNYGIKTTNYEVSIPKELSLAFINLCKRNNYYPIIMHTHEWYYSDENISFSKKDLLFMKNFVKFCRKLGLNLAITFWVTNGKYYQQCIFDKVSSEEKLNLSTIKLSIE